jgi:hypothetical protein
MNLMLWIKPLLDKWAALTARERAGVAALGAVAVLALASSSFDWMLGAQERAGEARAARMRMEAVAERQTDTQWRGRVAETAGHVWAWSVVETTPSIAEARAQSELEGLVYSAGISDPSVEGIATRDDVAGDVSALSFVIEGGFDWGSYMALLSAFEQSQLSIVPVAVDVSGSADGAPRFAMNVRMSFLDEDAGS